MNFAISFICYFVIMSDAIDKSMNQRNNNKGESYDGQRGFA